jgi:S1-C subfamily serine protease
MRRAAAAAIAVALVAPVITSAAPPPPEVVTVSVAGRTGPADVATGFAAGDERVVTVAHLLARAAITVRGRDGVERRAHVVRIDRGLDLAVLDVPGLRAPALRVGGRGDLRVMVVRGQHVDSIDSSLRRRIRAHVGDETRPALELAVDVTRGDSGAPVIAADGRVAGVVFARSTGRPETAYAVDAAPLERVIQQVSSP